MSASERPSKRLRPNSDFSHLAAKRLHTENFASSFPSEYNTFIIQPYWTPQFQDPEVSVPFSTQYGPFIQSENGLYASIQPPEKITQPSPDMFCTLLSARGRQPSVGGGKIQPTVGLASPVPVTGSNNVCFPDKCFGFTRGPHQWAESFAALVTPGHEPVNQHDMTHEHMHAVVNLDNESSAAEKAFIPSENSNSYVSDPYPVGNQRQMPMPVRERQYEDVFACDGPWLPSHPVLQPTFVQTAQPVTNTQTMIYPGDPSYPAQDSWGQVNYPGENIGRYVSLQAYGTQIEESHLEAGQHSDGSEREDYAVAHSALGHSRRGPFRNLDDRQQTAQTRKDKACIRCKMQRVRCIPDPENLKGACLTCRKATNIKITKLPCLRYKVTEIRIFKPGQVPGLDWTRRWQDLKIKNISKWDSPDIKVIRTTEGFSSIPLTLEVRKFVPEEGDVLDRFWFTSSGLKKSVPVPPYAIANVDAAQKEYSEYINRGGAEFFDGWLKNKDKLLVRTYSTAIATANSPDTPEQEVKLLKMVLRLWVAIRITTRSIRICGEETLGMRHDLLDETSPLRGEIPVPPVMGAQIELILIQRIQIPLRKKVLETLQALIVANKPNTWFTIYLCSFILLHNCSMITKYDSGYAKKYGFPGVYARPTEVQDYHTGANVLLAYWHYCNRGSQPFTTGKSAAGFHAMAQLSSYQTELIKDTSLYIEANANKWQSLREERAYGDDFFFVSQLYEEDWQPRISVI